MPLRDKYCQTEHHHHGCCEPGTRPPLPGQPRAPCSREPVQAGPAWACNPASPAWDRFRGSRWQPAARGALLPPATESPSRRKGGQVLRARERPGGRLPPAPPARRWVLGEGACASLRGEIRRRPVQPSKQMPAQNIPCAQDPVSSA